MKYYYNKESYMGKKSSNIMIDTNDDFDAILVAHGLGNPMDFEDYLYDLFDEEIDSKNLTKSMKKKVIENLNDANGDGQPYLTIMDEKGKQIFG